MLPLRLELSNFLAYRQPPPISFEGLHVACLSGPNGSGKSSLLDAITWALWKRARVNEDDKLLHIGQTEMFVVFEFQQEGARYRVRRAYRKKGATGSSELDLFAWDGEEWLLMSESQSIRDKQKQINDLLKLDYETFVHSAFVQQGKADAFTTRTPGQRKAILAEILGLSRWGQYEERAKAKLTEINQDILNKNSSIAERKAEEAREPEYRQAVEQAQTALESAQRRLETAEAAYSEKMGAPAALNAAQDKLKTCNQRINELTNDLKTLDDDLKRQAARRASFLAVLAQREQIEADAADHAELEQINEALLSLQKQHNALEKQRAEAEARLKAERAGLEATARSHQKRLKEARLDAEQITGIETGIAATTRDLAALTAQREQCDEYVAVLQALGEEEKVLSDRNTKLDAEIVELRQRYKLMQDAREALCPACGQPLGKKQREEVLERYKRDGVQRRETFDANKARIGEIANERKRIQDTLAQIEKALNGYDGLKQREGSLMARLEKAQQAAQRAEQEQEALAQVIAVLDAESYGEEPRAEIAAVEAELDALGYDAAYHAEVQEQIKQRRPALDKRSTLAVAIEALPDLEAAIESGTARQRERQASLQEAQAQQAELNAEIRDLAVQVAEAKAREAALREARLNERKAADNLAASQQRLASLISVRQKRHELETERDQLQGEASVYETLREAFGAKGVPAIIIEQAIPELETTANELLSRMTDGRMNIRFDTQRQKKTGGVIETLDILISDELGTRDYDMFSGGEGFRVNFALRIALSQFLARRAGARLQTLVIDEGFGSQDNVGRERLIEAINAIQDYFDLILVVTHIEELREAFPSHIEVRKTDHGSELSIR